MYASILSVSGQDGQPLEVRLVMTPKNWFFSWQFAHVFLKTDGVPNGVDKAQNGVISGFRGCFRGRTRYETRSAVGLRMATR